MLKLQQISLLGILLLLNFNLHSQIDSTKVTQINVEDDFWKTFDDQPRISKARVVFYNTENFYDTEDDSLKSDESFTPDGVNHWSKTKYWKKVNNLSKVITAIGGWDYPEIIGMCEIENRRVLEDLTKRSGLSSAKYSIVHYDSPDNRGIDVAFLYRPDRFHVIHSEAIPLTFPNDPTGKTRDILYVSGVFKFSTDTVHFFVNHWPSRYGGYAATIDKRNHAAEVVRNKVDSLLNLNENNLIFIMGDLNDYPSDESLVKHLRALPDVKNAKPSDVINLMYPIHAEGKFGSHKYQDHWGILDQMIVSYAFLKKTKGLHISEKEANIFRAPFLLIPDEGYIGIKPFRTFVGFKYIGGFSDHLPVYVDITE